MPMDNLDELVPLNLYIPSHMSFEARQGSTECNEININDFSLELQNVLCEIIDV